MFQSENKNETSLFLTWQEQGNETGLTPKRKQLIQLQELYALEKLEQLNYQDRSEPLIDFCPTISTLRQHWQYVSLLKIRS